MGLRVILANLALPSPTVLSPQVNSALAVKIKDLAPACLLSTSTGQWVCDVRGLRLGQPHLQPGVSGPVAVYGIPQHFMN